MSLEHIKSNDLKSKLGALLYTKYKVTGARVLVPTGQVTKVSNYEFKNFGCHSSSNDLAYMTVASGIGMTEEDVTTVVERIRRVNEELLREQEK